MLVPLLPYYWIIPNSHTTYQIISWFDIWGQQNNSSSVTHVFSICNSHQNISWFEIWGLQNNSSSVFSWLFLWAHETFFPRVVKNLVKTPVYILLWICWDCDCKIFMIRVIILSGGDLYWYVFFFLLIWLDCQ